MINEILTNPNEGTEWIELFNPDRIDLSGWIIEEKTGSGNTEAHIIGQNLEDSEIFDVFNIENKLNNSGDTITLKDQQGNQIDEFSYTSSTKGISFARIPDGGEWGQLNTPTKGASNGQPVASPDNSADALPSSSPVSSPAPNKATVKINQAKDELGSDISQAKIYVDGKYVHHYTPETLTFCPDCQCSEEVGCSLGEHEIKIEKTGFEIWEKTEMLKAGEKVEFNPVLTKTTASSPVPDLSPEAISNPVVKLASKKIVDNSESEATFTGQVLGATYSGTIESSSSPTTEVLNENDSSKLIFLGLTGSGLALLMIAFFPFFKPQLMEILHHLKA